LRDKLREETCIYRGELNRYADEDEPDRPIRNFEKWKNLPGYLHRQPRNDCVGNRHFVNIAPLQLGEEVFRVSRLSFPQISQTG
jgi:hypothetical protein